MVEIRNIKVYLSRIEYCVPQVRVLVHYPRLKPPVLVAVSLKTILSGWCFDLQEWKVKI
jgi:hypothetical protein